MFAGRISHSAIRIPHSVAEVAKLADAPDLGSGVERRASSSLALGTTKQSSVVGGQLSVRRATTTFVFGGPRSSKAQLTTDCRRSTTDDRRLTADNRQLPGRSTFNHPFVILFLVDEE
jgi:hypothetical protein